MRPDQALLIGRYCPAHGGEQRRASKGPPLTSFGGEDTDTSRSISEIQSTERGAWRSIAAQLSAAADSRPFAGPPAQPACVTVLGVCLRARHMKAASRLSGRTLARPHS